MINFDAVDFSERRPEEVISFFWRSVYMLIYNICPIAQPENFWLKIFQNSFEHYSKK